MKDTLYIGHLSTLYHTNFILMEDKKLVEDLDKTIEWVLFGTGPAMVKAFKKGQIDMGYMGLPPAIIGINKGVPIKCVAGGHVEGTIMIASEKYNKIGEFDGDIAKCFSQFIGKSIGVPSKGSIHDIILTYYLKRYNLTNKINIKYYGQPEFIALDLKKQILDAAIGTPALAVFAQTLLAAHIIIPAKHLWLNNPSYGIFFHKSFIENQPEIIISFLKYHKEASKLLRTARSIAAETISRNFGILTKSYVSSVLAISPKYCIALTEDYVKATMQFVKTLYQLGYISEILDIEQIFEFSFVEKVHPEENHYI
ncbi:MAG: ABC transporter substrate-binding protein [Promethearchaeota archaeon]|nr:MAG: ABC transporter substrate-binding protein [Candidatus Lokiarchaeota archaeon]